MKANEIIVDAFKSEVSSYIKAYGISGTAERFGHTGPFAYIPETVDLIPFLKELFSEENG